MKVGDTFLLWPKNPVHKEHLYIVMTTPDVTTGVFATINLTRSSHGPKAVTFRVGEHPFIKEYDSDANYGDSRITDETTVKDQIQWGQAVSHQPMNLDMVKRIALGAIGHPAIDCEVEEMIKAQWGL